MDIGNYLNAFETSLGNMSEEERAAWDAEIQRKEAEAEQKEKEKRFHSSGVPARYWPESLETYKINNSMQQTAAEAAVNFLHAAKCGTFKTLVLIGNAGTGKTHLACSIIKEVGGKYRSASALVEELRHAKSFNADMSESELLEYYGNIRLLVIDEIGRAIKAEEEKYMLYQIINARYNTHKPTILISNHSKGDFLNYVGVAAADRLVESAAIIELNGASYRRELRQ